MNRLKQLYSPRVVQLLIVITFFFFPPIIARTQTPSGSDPWAPDNIKSTEVLAGIVKDTKSPQPVILYVGPAALFKRAHIPGAQLIGLTSREEGLENLKKAAAVLDKENEIIVYCGCCPWEMCPNIRPAFQELQKMGFRKIRVLDLPNSFRQDWVTKGFPTEKTE